MLSWKTQLERRKRVKKGKKARVLISLPASMMPNPIMTWVSLIIATLVEIG